MEVEFGPPVTPEFSNNEVDEHGHRLGVEPERIDEILTVIEIGTQHVRDADGDLRFCTICGLKYKLGTLTGTYLQCAHLFHYTCVKKWLLTRKRCPICNRDVMPPPENQNV